MQYIEKINPRDHYLSAAQSAGAAPDLASDLWEMIITFLISQQNNISGSVDALTDYVKRYGEQKYSRKAWNTGLSTAEQLGTATEKTSGTRNGLSREYLVETTRSILSGESRWRSFTHVLLSRARQELMKLSGVGEKVADCICLFALHHMDAFRSTHISARLWTYTTKEDSRTADITDFGESCSSIFFNYELTGAADIHRTK